MRDSSCRRLLIFQKPIDVGCGIAEPRLSVRACAPRSYGTHGIPPGHDYCLILDKLENKLSSREMITAKPDRSRLLQGGLFFDLALTKRRF